jgi:uncharacterized membrane protein YqiK
MEDQRKVLDEERKKAAREASEREARLADVDRTRRAVEADRDRLSKDRAELAARQDAFQKQAAALDADRKKLEAKAEAEKQKLDAKAEADRKKLLAKAEADHKRQLAAKHAAEAARRAKHPVTADAIVADSRETTALVGMWATTGRVGGTRVTLILDASATGTGSLAILDAGGRVLGRQAGEWHVLDGGLVIDGGRLALRGRANLHGDALTWAGYQWRRVRGRTMLTTR